MNHKIASQDYVGIINKAFKSVIKKKQRVLITIDEVLHDDNMRVFASRFQIFVRQDYPIFLITTGPLSILQITRQYRDIFDIDEDKAKELANLTKGYAFAFQALGVCYWDNRDKGNDVVIEKYEELLDDFVYKKIWSSLTGKEREIVSAISDNEEKVGDICKRIKMSNGTFSKYKETLIAKGVLESRQYGSVSFALPRFHEVVRNYD